MSEIRATEYFAIIPESVLLAPISSNAVRLYAILNRFANAQGKAWPSRRTLAEMMGVSVATVDRAKDELVDLGALHVENRLGPNGDLTSNIYTLVMSSPVRKGSPTGDGRGSPTGDALNRVSMKQSQLAKSSPVLCSLCRGKNRDIETHPGQSSIYDETSRTYILCPRCDGEGQL